MSQNNWVKISLIMSQMQHGNLSPVMIFKLVAKDVILITMHRRNMLILSDF